jgi:UDP-N-acetyl-D-galactosamine dehydrogenase
MKIVSGSDEATTQMLEKVYSSVVRAGIHVASSLKVAEAAKVIENTQRDVNIALINELALIFNRLGIDTEEVLQAAGSKWNFLPFRPGLVGGHCIGVDPYYLTHKAQAIGYQPEIILAGRRINDNMGKYVVSSVVKMMIQRNIPIATSRVLILGLTFKENCPDIRNTRVVDMVSEMQSYGATVDVYDPWVDPAEAQSELGIEPIEKLEDGSYDAIILAVAHHQFKEMGVERLRKLGRNSAILYDIKHLLPGNEVDGRL